ncbi:hypothetical protein [Lentzea sp. NPDC059081]|uniref:hypothetical protein n=1 Tax=Lentzea sp. NPDC059081 TaxID=3346719 RepID=UPI0036CB014C
MVHKASELPPYRALLVVDIKEFSGVPGRYQAEVTDLVPVILRSAFERCGLIEVWSGRRFFISTGDGCAMGFPSAVLPLLLTPFLQGLQDELDYRDQVRADPMPLRMRVSVNIGAVTDSGQELMSEGSGASRVETHRLLDAQPVRDLLSRSGPATRVAAIVSVRAFHDAVVGGYTEDSQDLYVPAPVQVKQLTDVAYLRVPSPTGDLLHSGFLPRTEPGGEGIDEHASTEDRPQEAGSTTNSSQDVRGVLSQSRDHVNQGNTNYTFHGTGNVNSGAGNQFNGADTRYYDRRGS